MKTQKHFKNWKYPQAWLLSLALLGLIFFLFFFHAHAATTSFSSSLAVVGDKVITSRMVKINYLCRQSLQDKEFSKKMEAQQLTAMQDGTELFEKELKEVMLESVVAFEANSFAVGSLDNEELKAGVANLVKNLQGLKIYQELGVTEKELESTYLRQVQSKQFLKVKTENSEVKVSDEEALKYFEKNKVKFGALPFEQFKENIKHVLSREKMEESLKDWFEILKRKYKVRVLNKTV